MSFKYETIKKELLPERDKVLQQTKHLQTT